ncbi:hypothetical protein EIP86_011378 [Pleurotus ostreatoroseus]|nr:hypothetical protein EIP86_011378 [Pleurotus ostreatoroseus]
MDQAVAKKTLQDLLKNESLDNKHCVDCGSPNPQWATVSFAVFLCLQCAGVHRGFGVHVSFVRSVSMDTWQEEQIKRMQLGGNGPFKTFMKAYENGGYSEGMSAHDKYHCWAAAQYREKAGLDAELAGKPWSPSPQPVGYGAAGTTSPPGRPGSAQGLRKSRASTRSNTGRSASPASFTSSPLGTPNHSTGGGGGGSPSPSLGTNADQKTVNEAFFAGLGSANAARPADLPPSQGGRYQGFGSTPAPAAHPAYGTSSASVPRLADFQDDPVGALSKGWSLFSTAVAGAGRALSENVVRPAAERVMDPEFQAGVRGYVSGAAERAGEIGRSANTWGKSALGVDVAGQVGGVVGSVRDKIGGGPQRQGYGAVQGGMYEEGETSALYQDDEDFFQQYDSPPAGKQNVAPSSAAPQSLSSRGGASSKKKDDEWEQDEWKDF